MPGYVYAGTIRDAHLPWPEPPERVREPKSKTGKRRNPPPPCGTTRAYSLHRYHGEPVDPACAKANAESCARQRARKKAAQPPSKRRPPSPCGTASAYTRHRQRGEPIDQACRDAQARYCRERRARLKEKTA